MKLLTLILIGFLNSAEAAGGHQHHVKHNMVVHGLYEVFASHIVYKEPHNYQVILKLNLDQKTYQTYVNERTKYPKDQFIYLLDDMTIKDIQSIPSISGVLFRNDEQENQIPVVTQMKLNRGQFEVVYFEELPLSLSR